MNQFGRREAMFNNTESQLVQRQTAYDTEMGIVSALIGIIPGAIGAVRSLFGGGGNSGQARGLAAINAYGQQAIQTLQQILSQVQSGQLSPNDANTNAQRIAASLSDPAYVYQAQRGNDAEALRNFKTQANQLVQQIQQAATAAAQAQSAAQAAATGIDPVTGQRTSGIDTNTLLLLGGGGLLLMFLTMRGNQ